MCKICERGITFEPNDLVIRTFWASEWDLETNLLAYYKGMQLGKVLEITHVYGDVLVLWGADKDEEIAREWCLPSDFVARIRNGKYETIQELRDNPS